MGNMSRLFCRHCRHRHHFVIFSLDLVVILVDIHRSLVNHVVDNNTDDDDGAEDDVKTYFGVWSSISSSLSLVFHLVCSLHVTITSMRVDC